MNITLTNSIEKLTKQKPLTRTEFVALLKGNSLQLREILSEKANFVRCQSFGNRIYIRGLIEFSNYCRNDCLYCGIRHSNPHINRYRLTKEEILSCCKQGYHLGFRTFVLQSGEDPYFTDERMADIVSSIREAYPDCAITLSLGERPKKSLEHLFKAGADRYLLRHETADEKHYRLLHPDSMSFQNRMQCLKDLKRIGYQTGCGFMVGSPYQTPDTLASDLLFIQKFRPHMVGIGPFISHMDTPFSEEKNGSLEDTLLLISILRLMQPKLLLPATTALGTISPNGRELGILAGANVVMPNLSPVTVRKDYSLYNNKICTGDESAQCIQCMKKRMENINFEISIDRGDSPALQLSTY